jgi:hypothetical protein
MRQLSSRRLSIWSASLAVAVAWPRYLRADASATSAASTCGADADPGADLARTFREAVLAYRPPADMAAGVILKDAMRFVAQEANRVLRPHGDVLRRHVIWALAHLPRERLPDMSKWEHLPVRWLNEKDRAEMEAELPMRDFALAMLRDPAHAFALIQRLSINNDQPTWTRRVKVASLEGIAPARLVWANDDVERPVLAIVKRREIWEVDFAYDAASVGYLPQRIVWAKRPSLAAPSAAVAGDPGTTALRAFTDVVESYDVDGAKAGPSQFVVEANAFAMEQAPRLLGGAADALRARARCELAKRPRRALPDTKSWRVVHHGDPPNTLPPRTLVALPLLKWDPAWFFATIREQTRFAVESGTNSWRTVLDSAAPPVVVRTTDDLDNPTLAIIDRDEVFTVSFRYDPSIPGYAPVDINWLRRPVPSGATARQLK